MATDDASAAHWLAALRRHESRCFAAAMGAPLAAGLLLVAQVWLLAQVLGRMVQGQMALAELAPWVLGIVTLLALRALIHWLGERLASRAAERLKARVRQALFARLFELGPQWTRQQISGELASVLVDQVEQLDGYLTRYLPAVLAAVVLPLAFAVVLLPFDWVAALILLVTAPLIPVFMALVGWGAQAASARHQQAMVRLSGRFADRLRGAFTLRLFGRTQDEVAAMRAASHALSQKTLGVLRIAFLSSAVLEFFAALGVAGIALYIGLSYLGFLQVQARPVDLPLGLFALFMAPEVYNPLRQLAASYHDRAAAVAAVDQIAHLFQGLPQPAAPGARPRVRTPAYAPKEAGTGAGAGGRAAAPDAAMAQDATAAPGTAAAPAWIPVSPEPPAALQVRGLDMPDRHAGALWSRPLDLTLMQGEHLALMGASGVGKTSLLEALAGLRVPLAGEVQVLGWRWMAAAQAGLEPARVGPPPAVAGAGAGAGRCGSMVGGVATGVHAHPELGARLVFISQRPFFLAGTVADNLRLAAPATDAGQWQAALQRACAWDFVAASHEGLYTRLGEMGHGLSGGQLRRLALARLFLLDPGVVLLDEPTAHLDAATAHRVLTEIVRFCRGRTLILATHDARVADALGRCLVLQAGRDSACAG
ncbi:thiol reductant ABC exporter subunit CydD [Castellaniella sp.]|uniref:thiol reductant ABC exporter subunit CydD n=1 Tax=Castellaniella sp. TaxID=1955812 RepID=UPI00355E4808